MNRNSQKELFYWFVCKESLIWNDSLMYLARFLFHSLAPKRVVSFSSSVYFAFLMSGFSNKLRRSAYNGHSARKWISVSMTEHAGQRRLFLSIFLCLPTSIMSLWLDSLSFVIATLFLTFVTSFKWLSNPMCFLILPYVLSLLSSDVIVLKAPWWKMSLSLWESFLCTFLSGYFDKKVV